MFRKKVAITLIEVIVYLSICSIIFLTVPTTISFIESYKDKMESYTIKDSVHNFLINAKLLCKKEGKAGQIYFGNNKELVLYFTNNSSKVEKLELKDKYNVYFNNNNINITNLGTINTAGTIIVKNDETIIAQITIKVGSDIIEVKE